MKVEVCVICYTLWHEVAHISVSVVCGSWLCQDASKLNFCVSVRRPSLLSSTPAHRNQKENWVRGEVGHVHRACSVRVCLRGRVRTGGLGIPQVNSASVIFSDQQNTFEMLERRFGKIVCFLLWFLCLLQYCPDETYASSKQRESDSEDEQPKPKIVCSPPPTSQRVPIFPGLSPAALIVGI